MWYHCDIWDEATAEYANAYLGDLFLTIGNLQEAEKHLKKAIALAPDNGHYNYLLGFTYSKGEGWNKAVKAFRKALALEPDNDEYERGLGWAMFNGLDSITGISHLYRALDLCPSNVNATMDLASAMLLLENIPKANSFSSEKYHPLSVTLSMRLRKEISSWTIPKEAGDPARGICGTSNQRVHVCQHAQIEHCNCRCDCADNLHFISIPPFFEVYH